MSYGVQIKKVRAYPIAAKLKPKGSSQLSASGDENHNPRIQGGKLVSNGGHSVGARESSQGGSGVAGGPASKELNGQILKLTPIGFWLHCEGYFFVVGEEWEVHFELPASHLAFVEGVKVVKTIDRFDDKNPKIKHKMTEMHFTLLPEDKEKAIKDFTNRIGQK